MAAIAAAELLCTVRGCDRPRHTNGRGGRYPLCGAHRSRKQRHGDVMADKPLRARSDWRPEEPCGYHTAHTRIHSNRGPASAHPCVDCGAPAEEWSYNHSGRYELTEVRHIQSRTTTVTYSTDPAEYDPRCRPCHRRQDSLHALRKDT